jgi:hypothetical protein
VRIFKGYPINDGKCANIEVKKRFFTTNAALEALIFRAVFGIVGTFAGFARAWEFNRVYNLWGQKGF